LSFHFNHPAFWQTTFFLILGIVLSIAAIYVIVWLLVKRRRDKEHKKNEIDRLITEYKLVALKAQINPHFMSNCIAAIQHLIISNKVDEANEYLAKFSFW